MVNFYYIYLLWSNHTSTGDTKMSKGKGQPPPNSLAPCFQSFSFPQAQNKNEDLHHHHQCQARVRREERGTIVGSHSGGLVLLFLLYLMMFENIQGRKKVQHQFVWRLFMLLSTGDHIAGQNRHIWFPKYPTFLLAWHCQSHSSSWSACLGTWHL